MKPPKNSQEISGNRAYQAIKEMIFNYHLVPGQKLTYNGLAEKLKMSKTPIINALNRLEQEEFVISLPNRGYFIKEINVDEVEEMFKVREALEMLVVEEGIEKRKGKMMKEVEKARVAHRQYNREIMTRKRLALDASFHLKIAEMGGNRNLVRLLKHVLEHIYLRHRSEGISPRRLAEAAEEHEKLIRAIKEGNRAKAKRLMRQHLQAGKVATIKGIRRAAEQLRF